MLERVVQGCPATRLGGAILRLGVGIAAGHLRGGTGRLLPSNLDLGCGVMVEAHLAQHSLAFFLAGVAKFVSTVVFDFRACMGVLLGRWAVVA